MAASSPSIASDSAPSSPPAPARRRKTIGSIVVAILLLCFAAFWTWALFFASKEAVNRFEDRAWAERAQQICLDANTDREALADYRRIDASDAALLRERGDLIDASTDVVERMVDEVTATLPADPKGAALVPQWEQEYRLYLQNRRDYAAAVRSGSNEPFRETAAGGIPISERLRVFAGDNEMPACSPPRDL